MVRQTLSEVRLTSVMFEVGARPHASGDVYRDYRSQSVGFVAVYEKLR